MPLALVYLVLPYATNELWFGHSPPIRYFKIFRSKCYIKRDDDIGNFDPRRDEGMFLGYSLKN